MLDKSAICRKCKVNNFTRYFTNCSEMYKTIILILELFLIFKTYSQTGLAPGSQEKSFCLRTGIGYNNYVFTELGLSVNQFITGSPHSFSSSFSVSSEIYFAERTIIAPKAGIWLGVFPLVFGFYVVDYTDFHQQSLALRPEMGFGFYRFAITYGYNAKLQTTSFEKISKNCLSLSYSFKLKTLATKKELH